MRDAWLRYFECPLCVRKDGSCSTANPLCHPFCMKSPCVGIIFHINISLCLLVSLRARDERFATATGSDGGCVESGGGAKPFAHSGAFGAGRPDRLRPHDNIGAVTAAGFASSEAAGRS